MFARSTDPDDHRDSDFTNRDGVEMKTRHARSIVIAVISGSPRRWRQRSSTSTRPRYRTRNSRRKTPCARAHNRRFARSRRAQLAAGRGARPDPAAIRAVNRLRPATHRGRPKFRARSAPARFGDRSVNSETDPSNFARSFRRIAALLSPLSELSATGCRDTLANMAGGGCISFQ